MVDGTAGQLSAVRKGGKKGGGRAFDALPRTTAGSARFHHLFHLFPAGCTKMSAQCHFPPADIHVEPGEERR